MLQIPALAQSPTPQPSREDRVKKLEEEMRAFQKSTDPQMAELTKYCRHGQGQMTIKNGKSTLGCRYGFTPLFYEDQWNKEGRSFSSLSPQEFQDYCDADFITITETKIYPGETCTLTHEGPKSFIACKEREGSKEVTELMAGFCTKLHDRKLAEEKPACGVNQPLNPKQSQAVKSATGALSKDSKK